MKYEIKKSILEKKEKINLKNEKYINLKDKLNNENKFNTLNNKSIIKGNNNIKKTYLYICFNSGKRREEKKLLQEEGPQIKANKDIIGFCKDKKNQENIQI